MFINKETYRHTDGQTNRQNHIYILLHVYYPQLVQRLLHSFFQFHEERHRTLPRTTGQILLYTALKTQTTIHWTKKDSNPGSVTAGTHGGNQSVPQSPTFQLISFAYISDFQCPTARVIVLVSTSIYCLTQSSIFQRENKRLEHDT